MRRIDTKWQDRADRYLLLDNTDEFTQQCTHHNVRFGSGNWYGGHGVDDAIRHLHTGLESMVTPSDRMVEDLEGTEIHTKKWRNMDDCVGSIPNVPAMLAGHPMNMRRRQKLDQDDAPITVFIDLDRSEERRVGKEC